MPQARRYRVCVCVCVRSAARSRPTLCSPMDCGPRPRLLHPWDSPGKNIGVGSHALLYQIFPTRESNPHLLHWQVDSWPLCHLESPRYHIYNGAKTAPETMRWELFNLLEFPHKGRRYHVRLGDSLWEAHWGKNGGKSWRWVSGTENVRVIIGGGLSSSLSGAPRTPETKRNHERGLREKDLP